MSWNYPPNQGYPVASDQPVVCPPPYHHDTGFQDGNIFRIESAADSMVLDVAGNSAKKGGKIITYTNSDQDNQKFTAHKLGIGFRLVPVLQGKKGELVLDYSRQSGTLTLWESNNGTNQMFMAQETAPRSQLFVIKCLDNNYCLRHNGHGSQVTVVPETPGDILQQWKIHRTY